MRERAQDEQVGAILQRKSRQSFGIRKFVAIYRSPFGTQAVPHEMANHFPCTHRRDLCFVRKTTNSDDCHLGVRLGERHKIMYRAARFRAVLPADDDDVCARVGDGR